MQYGSIPDSAKPVSRIVYGCDRLDRAGLGRLDEAFARGINAFDTARIYGRSELALGSWMRAHGVREDVFVITKGGHPRAPDRPRAMRDEIYRDLDKSLRDLGTDYVDLYLMHYDAPELAPEAILEIMDGIKVSGKAKAVGGANVCMQRLRAIQSDAVHLGRTQFSAVSLQFSLPVLNEPMWAWPGSISIGGEAGRDARQWYASQRLPVFAYSCLGRGFFSEAYWSGIDPPEQGTQKPRPGSQTDLRWLRSRFESADNLERYSRAKALAARKGVTPAQLGISYVFASEMEVFAILSWSSAAQCNENVAGLECVLSPAERDWLELASHAEVLV
jgi:aryl-alcohol dehydrogenase-like predicted oxidoreductase